MKKNSIFVLGSLLILAAMILSACSSGNNTGNSGSSGSGGSTNVSVSMTEFKFDPADVTVPAGSTVNLTLKNDGSVQHSWVVLKQGVNDTSSSQFSQDQALYSKVVDPGKTVTDTFTAPSQPGQYEIICDIPGHLDAGMKGTLTVK